MRTCKRERCDKPVVRADPRALYCSHKCRKAAWDEQVVAECPDCGRGLTRHASVKKKGSRCADCFHAARGRAFEVRAGIIADLWAEGLSRAEIAAEFGWSDDHASVEFDRIRRRLPGLLPYRYKLKNPRAQEAA